MGNLDPVAFDIETSGLGEDAVITVAGIAHELGEVVILNTASREASGSRLEQTLVQESVGCIEVIVTESEEALLEVLTTIARNRLNDDTRYLTAYNGEA